MRFYIIKKNLKEGKRMVSAKEQLKQKLEERKSMENIETEPKSSLEESSEEKIEQEKTPQKEPKKDGGSEEEIDPDQLIQTEILQLSNNNGYRAFRLQTVLASIAASLKEIAEHLKQSEDDE